MRVHKKIALILTYVILFGVLGQSRNVKIAGASGTIYIRADGSIDPPTANITTIDNVTYTFIDNIYESIVVERSNIMLDGAGYTLQGPGSGNGLYWTGMNNVTIRNTNIRDFYYGILSEHSSNNSFSENTITCARAWKRRLRRHPPHY